ncbi:hypothetical protein [Marinoscillum sp. MHG1-6]|uniref:hypothetical protein n=1 Tax=Marinoscillum sp. MHG1-6 TaxID=2959627 RepID=UPI002157A60F|nr:hypothetical protein [Marinoscillum sp. MHG1-6]
MNLNVTLNAAKRSEESPDRSGNQSILKLGMRFFVGRASRLRMAAKILLSAS